MTGYVNNTLRQILPYRVDRQISERHCPNIPQNFTSVICSGDKMCLHDYFTTGETLIANHTRESSQQYSTNSDVLSKGQELRFLYGIFQQYLHLVKWFYHNASLLFQPTLVAFLVYQEAQKLVLITHWETPSASLGVE